ncbi:hypothetical protein [Albibacterium indicum]|uniref:hypothetical protein n=1 Tax=Albibacterium indicum TaxID=2292082 RepID=UPI000E5110B4|nr:hypothetical protein [Pedobacter indicus]
MKEQEIQTILKDQQDILVHMNEQLHRIEQQKPETGEDKDYSAELEHISRQLGHLLKDDTLIEFKESMHNNISFNRNLVATLIERQGIQETLIKEMPQKMKIDVEHRITGNQRPYIIAGVTLFLVVVFSLFASIQLWRNNSSLHNSDVKIRAVKLLYPNVFLDVDSVYHDNPKKLEAWIEQEEDRLIALTKAEEAARQSKEQAEVASERLQRLKVKKNRDSE